MWYIIVLIIVLILLCNKKKENFSVLNGDFQSLLDKEMNGFLYEKDSGKINTKSIPSNSTDIDKIMNKYNIIDKKIFNIPYVQNMYNLDLSVPSHKSRV